MHPTYRIIFFLSLPSLNEVLGVQLETKLKSGTKLALWLLRLHSWILQILYTGLRHHRCNQTVQLPVSKGITMTFCGMDTWVTAHAMPFITLSIMFLEYRNFMSLPLCDLVMDVLLAKPLNSHSHPLLPGGHNHLVWFTPIFVNFLCNLTLSTFGWWPF